MSEIRRNYPTGRVTNADQQFGYYGQAQRLTTERAAQVAEARKNGTAMPETPVLHDPTPEDIVAGKAFYADPKLSPQKMREAMAGSRNFRTNFEAQRQAEVTARDRAENAKDSRAAQAYWNNPQVRDSPKPAGGPTGNRTTGNRTTGAVPGAAFLAGKLRKPGGILQAQQDLRMQSQDGQSSERETVQRTRGYMSQRGN